MRRQAILLLQAYPPEVTGKAFKCLLRDPDSGNQNLVAQYLVLRSYDGEARKVILHNATVDDPAVATSAIGVLGALQGEDVDSVLLETLRSKNAPRSVRLAAILAAGTSRATKCSESLFALLSSEERRSTNVLDRSRICDLAASSLERMHGINHTGIDNVYHKGTLEDRDAGIGLWRQWHKSYGDEPIERWRLLYLNGLIDQAERLSAANEPMGTCSNRLRAALGTTFCLNEGVGSNRIIISSVRGIWRLLQVTPQDRWQSIIGPWKNLDRRCREVGLFSDPVEKQSAKKQAFEFVLFANGEREFPRVAVWALCRDYSEAFPASTYFAEIEKIKDELDSGFRKEFKKVVLHGRRPVLEPIPREVELPDPKQVIAYGNALGNRIIQEPSNWSYHRLMVEYFIRTKRKDERYPLYYQVWRYPENEWPHLADSIYQHRHRHDLAAAIESADKAIILNPQNAKAYVIRGIIKMEEKKTREAAFSDLRRAFNLDPKSFGDEPETAEAVAFFLEGIVAIGGSKHGRIYWLGLQDLKSFRSEIPLKNTPRFNELSKRILSDG
jgi:tetratricopeptide (TPR) repeat protein